MFFKLGLPPKVQYILKALFMAETNLLLWSILFGGIGLGFFSYGRKQRAIVPLFTGFALFAFPYFMPNLTWLIVVGSALIALPYFIRL
jgi:hypothetical protein